MPEDFRDFNFNDRGDREKADAMGIRQQMRVRGENELFYLSTTILGFTRLTVKAHMPLCVFMDTCPTKRRMEQMPRSHFKTTIVTVAKRIQDMVKDPTLRILIVGDTEPNACKHLRKITTQYERNELFRWVYEDRMWEDARAQAPTWSRNAVIMKGGEFHGESSIDAIGARGAAVSRHYDIINADDLIGEEEYFSNTEMGKTIDWFSGIESLFIPPESSCQMDIPSTYWRTDDVYAFAEKFYGNNQEPVPTGPHSYLRGQLAVFRRANIEDGLPIFPKEEGGFSVEFYNRLRERNPERYAAQYANNPYQSGTNVFKEQYLRYYTWAVPDFTILYERPGGLVERVKVGNLRRIGLCDPHAGGTQSRSARFIGGSRAAVIMTGVDETTGRVYILDCWIKQKDQTDKIISEIIRQNEKWMPEVFSVEANGLQKMIKPWLMERIEREGRLDVPYTPYIPQGDKDGTRRIMGLQPMLRAGQIVLQAGFAELIEEFLVYPRGFKDGLDALAQGQQHWGVSFDDAEEAEVEAFEERMRSNRSVLTGY